MQEDISLAKRASFLKDLNYFLWILGTLTTLPPPLAFQQPSPEDSACGVLPKWRNNPSRSGKWEACGPAPEGQTWDRQSRAGKPTCLRPCGRWEGETMEEEEEESKWGRNETWVSWVSNSVTPCLRGLCVSSRSSWRRLHRLSQTERPCGSHPWAPAAPTWAGGVLTKLRVSCEVAGGGPCEATTPRIRRDLSRPRAQHPKSPSHLPLGTQKPHSYPSAPRHHLDSSARLTFVHLFS